MARALILSFKDNDIAEAVATHLLGIAAAFDNDGEVSTRDVGTLGSLLAAGAQVEALIAQPKAFCRCRGNKRGQYEKTKRFGWMVHKPCNKPSWYIVRDFIENMYLGYNNLLFELQPDREVKEQRSYGG